MGKEGEAGNGDGAARVSGVGARARWCGHLRDEHQVTTVAEPFRSARDQRAHDAKVRLQPQVNRGVGDNEIVPRAAGQRLPTV